ncbi:MAG: hypothetical protein KJ961_03450 [Alphaproteobacteria bacterium]|nr:hypothetical protein [Alphaproteobacteria bacterium]
MGIGFSDGAGKLREPLFFAWFQLVYWLGPVALIAGPFALLTFDVSRQMSVRTIGIVFAAIFLLMFIQIGTLIYISG